MEMHIEAKLNTQITKDAGPVLKSIFVYGPVPDHTRLPPFNTLSLHYAFILVLPLIVDFKHRDIPKCTVISENGGDYMHGCVDQGPQYPNSLYRMFSRTRTTKHFRVKMVEFGV